MIIYGALLIPIITAFILYKYFSHKTIWWEFAVPFIVSLIFIVSMKSIIEAVQVSCKEYWGSFIKQVNYYEDWNEYIHRICTRSCGKNCITTYDCSYVQYHPPRWEITTTTNETVSITQREYNRVKSIFNNESFVDLHRHHFTNDGDLYYSSWSNDSVRAVPVTTIHRYENRIKASDQSVFHYGEVSDSDKVKYSLKEYPEIWEDYKTISVLGDSSQDALLADKKAQYINGLLGSKKEVRLFILVFKNQPIEAAIYQEWYWCGGNMNEIVACIGIDNQRNIKWAKTISWTRSESLKAEITQHINSQSKLNLSVTTEWMKSRIESKFKRRDFKEFNYLTVEPPLWAVILTYLLTITINVLLSRWIILNEHKG